MPKEMTAGELAERSLITKYRKTIWNRFIGGCKDYELIKPGGSYCRVHQRGKGQYDAGQMHAASAEVQRFSL